MKREDFFTLIKSRRSIRQFTGQRPDRNDIERLIEAAGWAPSNHNRQGWKFIVFEDREQIESLAQRVRLTIKKMTEDSHRLIADKSQELIHFAGIFEEAPVVILAMHKKTLAVGKKMANELVSGEALSTAMAVQNLLLAAHALGLGACVMTAPLLAEDVWTDLPAGFEPTCIVALGYAAQVPEAPRRKKLEHLIEYR